MKKIYLVLTAITAVLLISCDNTDKDIYASGTFDAREVIVSSKLNGEILEFTVSEGDIVEEGQTLGRIDSEQLELQKEQLLSSIKSVEARRPDMNAQLAPLSQQIKTAKKEEQRIASLYKVGAATEKDHDDLYAQLLSLEKQHYALESTLKKSNDGITEDLLSLEIQVRLIDDKIGYSSITSPIDGRVLSQYAEQGEYALPGKAIVKIADMDKIFLRAYVTSAQLTELKLGQSVTVVADFGEKDNRTYNGTLSWISDKSEFTPKTVQTRDERSNLVYAVKIDVENDGYLKIGMYGGMKISNE
jgi:membrane fusion protein YbhG